MKERDTERQEEQPPIPPERPRSPRKLDPSALNRLFDEWMNGDETEQRETFEILRHALDEHRPPGYRLFS